MIGSLHPRDVIVALGIDAEVIPGWSNTTLVEIGSNGARFAALVRCKASGRVLVALDEDQPSEWADALHEAIHGALGVHTFGCEAGLMAVEWSVAQELAEPTRRGVMSSRPMPWMTTQLTVLDTATRS